MKRTRTKACVASLLLGTLTDIFMYAIPREGRKNDAQGSHRECVPRFFYCVVMLSSVQGVGGDSPQVRGLYDFFMRARSLTRTHLNSRRWLARLHFTIGAVQTVLLSS